MTRPAVWLAPHPVSLSVTDFPRIIRLAYAHDPKGVGSGPSRFSSPSKAFCVLYAARDFQTALAEAVIRDRFVGRERRHIGRATLAARAVTLVSTTEPLTVVDARGDTAYSLGIDADAVRGRSHQPGQEFSERLHRATIVDDILYDSRLTGRACIAIYERALVRVVAAEPRPLLMHAELAPKLARMRVVVRKTRRA